MKNVKCITKPKTKPQTPKHKRRINNGYDIIAIAV